MPGWAGAPRAISLGFGAVLGHGWVNSPVWEILDELAEGLAPLSHSYKEHPEQFPTAVPRMGTLFPVGCLGRRGAAGVAGHGGSCGILSLLC